MTAGTSAGAPHDASPAVVESYRRLADVFHDVLSEQSLDALLERIADTMADLIPHDDLAFYEADETARTLRGVFARGDYADEVLADAPFGFGEGITGWAVQQREPVLANRADLDPRVRFVEGTPPEPESLIAVPLVARGSVKGALNIYRVGLTEFTEEEFRLAVRFGDAAALALDNAEIRAGLELQAQTDPLTGLWNHRSFHERLRRELVRASSEQSSVALLMLDLDDFKKVNDIYGHAVGDTVLAAIAEHLRSSMRTGDSVCRVGGEEFAIIVPGADTALAQTLAERVLSLTQAVSIEPAGPIGVSVGVAVGPEHAANPRELVGCAELAMMTAKARGKGQIVTFGDEKAERPVATASDRREDLRSISHLKMLHDVSGKLSRLNDVQQIGSTIADELRPLIDYHNCRVFLREGDELRPIAFRGDLSTPTETTLEAFATRVGVGITGHVAATGEPYITGDAASSGIGHRIPGTAQIDESLLAVPLRYGHQVVGVIVISKLGRDQFDADDQRLLEVLAGHVSIALVNAQLFEAQRREAESAKSLLALSRDLASVTGLDEVADRVVAGAATIIGSPHTSLWLPDAPGADLRCTSSWSTPGIAPRATVGDTLPPSVAEPFLEQTEPFVIERADYTRLVPQASLDPATGAYAVAPIVVDAGWGALAVAFADAADVDQRCLELLAGIASQARLAINTSLGFASLERTFIATVEALANALEAKDAYTSSHARWIMDMAVRVGQELGLDGVDLKRLELGALFHDIGKIGVPAEILTKPGPLTDEERAVVERHPEVGERILAPIEQLASVRPIVRACHERYDGLGYPDGLRGEEIPLESRIIFACDAFHAMTTNRPYRSALPAAEARRRLRDEAGAQFDPRVVDACLRLLDAPEGEAPTAA